MTNINLKDAFGETPESIKACVRRSLHEEQRREPIMKRKLSVSLIAAVLALALMGCAALAAAQMGFIESLFAHENPENGELEVDQSITEAVQAMDVVYEGDSVRCTLNEVLWDEVGNSYVLNWTMEPLADGDNLYVICDGVRFGGERAHERNCLYYTEYFLKEAVNGMVLGELPGNASPELEMSFTILRPTTELVKAVKSDAETPAEYQSRVKALLEEGNLVVESDGYLRTQHDLETSDSDSDTAYSDHLLSTGVLELADRFTLKADLSVARLNSTVRTIEGPTEFVFDTCELRVTECTVTPTSAYLEIQYITNEQPTDGGKGMGTMLDLYTEVPGVETWCGNADGTIYDPVQLEDGRWMTLFTCEAIGLKVFPDELIITPVTYTEEDNHFIPTAHTDCAATLKLTK